MTNERAYMALRERQVLGSMLLWGAAGYAQPYVRVVMQQLRPSDFTIDEYKKTFHAMQIIFDQGQPIEYPRLARELAARWPEVDPTTVAAITRDACLPEYATVLSEDMVASGMPGHHDGGLVHVA